MEAGADESLASCPSALQRGDWGDLHQVAGTIRCAFKQINNNGWKVLIYRRTKVGEIERNLPIARFLVGRRLLPNHLAPRTQRSARTRSTRRALGTAPSRRRIHSLEGTVGHAVGRNVEEAAPVASRRRRMAFF